MCVIHPQQQKKINRVHWYKYRCKKVRLVPPSIAQPWVVYILCSTRHLLTIYLTIYPLSHTICHNHLSPPPPLSFHPLYIGVQGSRLSLCNASLYRFMLLPSLIVVLRFVGAIMSLQKIMTRVAFISPLEFPLLTTFFTVFPPSELLTTFFTVIINQY